MNIKSIYVSSGIILILIILIPYIAYGQDSQDMCFDVSVSMKEITTTYDILIPFSTTNISIFEPNEISIPVNTVVRWINLNNSTYNINVVKENNATTNTVNFDIETLGGTYSHKFSKAGEYKYYNINNKNNPGKITVGDTIQKGKFTTMTMGTNLPIKTSELKKRTLSLEPNFETTNIQIPENGPIKYNFTITNPLGINIYSKEIIDVDGRLYIEFIPFPSKIIILPTSNSSDTGLLGVVSKMKEIGTQADFITWGFVDNLNTNSNCLKGILRIMGPVLVDVVRDGIKITKPYSINVSILQEGTNSLIDTNYSDTFILPIR